MSTPKGKFIVIDGTDGSGKQTQSELLIKRLETMGMPFETIDFPRYGQKSAILVDAYLKLGDFGPIDEVDPRVASTFYAVDRWHASEQIRKWLDAGRTVIADRFVASNMGHQGAKFTDKEELRKFLEWDHDLEHVRFGIPEPDLNVILHVPTDVTLELIKKRGGAQDLHESNPDHLRAAERTYLTIAEMYPDKFKVVECAPEGKLLSRGDIHSLIWNVVYPVLTGAQQTA